MPAALRQHAGEYRPTNPALLRRIIARSRIDPRSFAFVDLGCGKGRVLIAAADYPFQSIVGIEADSGLCRIAETNLARVAFGHRPVSVVCGDVQTAVLPDGDLFVFMYNPFRGAVFLKVAERLAMAAREPGRAVVVAYSNDREGDVLERTSAFRRVRMRRRQFWAPPSVSFFYNSAADPARRVGSLGRFVGLERDRRRLLIRAVLLLAGASAALTLMPFRRAIAFGSVPLRRRGAGANVEDCVWAVEAAARRVPWRAMCIEQGLAVQRMLRESGIGAVLHYGANREAPSGDLKAHVWVSVDGKPVIGGREAADYREVATFP